MFPAVATRRVAVALVLCFVALSACGDRKDKKKGGEDDAAPAQAQPPPDKERSFLAKGCEKFPVSPARPGPFG